MPPPDAFDAPSAAGLRFDIHPPVEDMAGPARVAIVGEVDDLCAAQVHDVVLEVLRRHRPRRLEMDLSGVSFLDSSGIRALLLCHADAEQADCRMTITSAHRVVYQVLEITYLLDHFGLRGDGLDHFGLRGEGQVS